MGCRKTYDRDEVTDRVMQLFWERGYHDTSTRDLTEAVVRYFGGGANLRASTLGCLAYNAAVELAPTPDASRKSTDRYLDRVAAALRNALHDARSTGDLHPDTAVDELAQFLTVTVTGMFVLIRSGSNPDFLVSTADQALAKLAAL